MVKSRSQEVTDFVGDWVNENINSISYDPPKAEVRALVIQLVEDAKAAGFKRSEITKEYGDLADFIHDELEKAVDREISGKKD